ncbi:hypothetical protein K227x_62100 [Rubripirellula lacrimiformis]|uniref:Uncharacterized protein n=1 Tax=Rubripirellula lacrimiformis TaxID=1930273 RepID=A0A517NKW8_9BACT|nr:hypothetical protein K227x_62100 [Rubripirellula lacrimiformis]
MTTHIAGVTRVDEIQAGDVPSLFSARAARARWRFAS